MIRTAIRAAIRGIRSFAEEPSSIATDDDITVDFGRWDAKVKHYRGLGARIGEQVRLIGALDGVNPHLVQIGDYSVIGKGSVLLAHCPINGARPVVVGKFVYLGYGAIVLAGVTLDDFCVVGAGAVVTKSAPAGSILAGNPARIIRTLTEEERLHIEKTLREARVFGWDSNRQGAPKP